MHEEKASEAPESMKLGQVMWSREKVDHHKGTGMGLDCDPGFWKKTAIIMSFRSCIQMLVYFRGCNMGDQLNDWFI